jgi:hypothetical protein
MALWPFAFVGCGGGGDSAEQGSGSGAGTGGSSGAAGSSAATGGNGAVGGTGAVGGNGSAGGGGSGAAGGAGTGAVAGSGVGGTAGAGGGNAGGAAIAGGSSVSYARDIKPIFESSCVYCHYTGGILIDIANPFAPTTGLVDADNTWAVAHPEAGLPLKNVSPGNPAQSFLMMKISGEALSSSAGSPMPWQLERLSDVDIAALRQWILDGAKNDDVYASSIHPIFGTPRVLGAGGGKCCYCHFAGGQAPNLEDPFDPSSGAVGLTSERMSSQKVIEPGNPDASFLMTKVSSTSLASTLGNPMPFRPEPLAAADVALVRAWIAAGAKND